MKPTPAPYTASELRDMLKDRQGGMTQVQFATDRSVGNDLVLKYLAPKGKKFVHHDCWTLVED
jgi:hypothetical protein